MRSGPTHDCLEWILRDVDLNAGSLGNQLRHARQERATTRQGYASGHHIGHQLGGVAGAAQALTDRDRRSRHPGHRVHDLPHRAPGAGPQVERMAERRLRP